MYLLKVYRYTPTGNADKPYVRLLYDALTFGPGGASSPLGGDEEFEVWIEEVV